MGGGVVGWAHPSEKSAPGFEDTSIHSLSCWEVKRLKFIADSSPSAVMRGRWRKWEELSVSVTVAVTFSRR
jgi:hypothetical protein